MTRLCIGLDIGTSGARAVAMGEDGRVVAEASAPIPPARAEGGRRAQDPWIWAAAADAALDGLLDAIPRAAVAAIAVDGTSGTLVAVDAAGAPLGEGLMYDDASARAEAARIAEIAPPTSGAHGATSGLAKALLLARAHRPARLLHQADWIAGRLSGRFDLTDENNALKTGYDPLARAWPGFIEALGLDRALLPGVREPGAPIGPLSAEAAARLGLSPATLVAAGTTDGCASFLATGAQAAGDAVSALGSTLTLKILSPVPVFDPACGVYSHRLGDVWLAGGASNVGGAAIAAHFDAQALARLEPRLDTDRDTGLDYYPLTKPGERFPVADPDRAPRLEPRPRDDAVFLQGIMEGIARVEAEGYARLAALGAPAPKRVLSVGGGAASEAFGRIRARILGVPVARASEGRAAAGAARLALRALGASAP